MFIRAASPSLICWSAAPPLSAHPLSKLNLRDRQLILGYVYIRSLGDRDKVRLRVRARISGKEVLSPSCGHLNGQRAQYWVQNSKILFITELASMYLSAHLPFIHECRACAFICGTVPRRINGYLCALPNGLPDLTSPSAFLRASLLHYAAFAFFTASYSDRLLKDSKKGSAYRYSTVHTARHVTSLCTAEKKRKIEDALFTRVFIDQGDR